MMLQRQCIHTEESILLEILLQTDCIMDRFLCIPNDTDSDVVDIVFTDQYNESIVEVGGGVEQVLAFTYDPANDNGSGQIRIQSGKAVQSRGGWRNV